MAGTRFGLRPLALRGSQVLLPLPRPVFRFGSIKNVAPSPRVAVPSASHTARTALYLTSKYSITEMTHFCSLQDIQYEYGTEDAAISECPNLKQAMWRSVREMQTTMGARRLH
jgi:hypothetical protein